MVDLDDFLSLQSIGNNFRLYLFAVDDAVEFFSSERFAILHLLIDDLIATTKGVTPWLFVGYRTIVRDILFVFL